MANDLWSTPQYIFDWLNEEFHFDLDAACNSKNCKCLFGILSDYNEDGLKEEWCNLTLNYNPIKSVWLNPPYSNPYPWVKKAYEESQKGCTVVCLLPADTSTKWFHEYILGKAEVRFIQGRIKFVEPETSRETKNAPKFGSIVAIFKPNIEPKVIGVKRPNKSKAISKNN